MRYINLRMEKFLNSWQFPLTCGLAFGVFVYLSMNKFVLEEQNRSFVAFTTPAYDVEKKSDLDLKFDPQNMPVVGKGAQIDAKVMEGLKKPKIIVKPFGETTEKTPSKCRQYRDLFRSVFPPKTFAYQRADNCTRWNRWITAIQTCLKEELQINKKVWNKLHKAIECCIRTFRTLLNVMPLLGKDDIKYIVFPPNLNNPCRTVTLGIGGDVTVEKKLQKIMPQCEIYGVDPDIKNEALFEDIGEFHLVAVSGKEKEKSKLTPLDANTTKYKKEEMNMTSLAKFLSYDIFQTEIDYMFIDIEGEEYSIIPEFFKNGSLPKNDITICHFTVEFHGPLDKHNMTSKKYGEMINRLIQESGFIPIWASEPQNHQRVFFTNAVSQWCIERYYFQWCDQPHID